MSEHVGIIREGDSLAEGVEKLEKLESKVAKVKAPGASQYNPGWNKALDLPSMWITGLAVARAAHMRTESRGAHTRLDHEGEHEEWLRYNVVIRKGADGEMQVEKEERPKPPPALKAIAYAKIEDLEAGKVGTGDEQE